MVPASGNKKYTAIVPGHGRVSFGDRRYEHFRDRVPRSRGGGKWSSKDHRDKARRASYRARHGALRCGDGRLCVKKPYSAAWFSYHFLW